MINIFHNHFGKNFHLSKLRYFSSQYQLMSVDASLKSTSICSNEKSCTTLFWKWMDFSKILLNLTEFSTKIIKKNIIKNILYNIFVSCLVHTQNAIELIHLWSCNCRFLHINDISRFFSSKTRTRFKKTSSQIFMFKLKFYSQRILALLY